MYDGVFLLLQQNSVIYIPQNSKYICDMLHWPVFGEAIQVTKNFFKVKNKSTRKLRSVFKLTYLSISARRKRGTEILILKTELKNWVKHVFRVNNSMFFAL